MNVMTAATVTSYEPVARWEDLDRLAAFLPSRTTMSQGWWTQLHDEIQEQLAPLENAVRREVAGIRVDQGRTQGENFALCSYRVFSMPESGLDPVVVGITFTTANQRVTVEGDVSGEQTGDLIFSVPSQRVGNSNDEILAVAHEVAHQLCHSAEAIAAALKNPSRGVE